MHTLKPSDTADRSIAPETRISDGFRATIRRNHRTLFLAANAFTELPSMVVQAPNESLHVLIPEENETIVLIRAVLSDGHPPLEHRYLRDLIPINPNLSELFAEQVISDLEASSMRRSNKLG